MNPTPPPTAPLLDATCNRIVAALTQRLAKAARATETFAPTAQHDFLVPIMHPELTERAVAQISSR
tara:strand:+ start:334 stop:531 length:198 start_codon:yes stop_codon:yes gene_type:complete